MCAALRRYVGLFYGECRVLLRGIRALLRGA